MTTRAKLWFVTMLTIIRFPLVMLFFIGAVVQSLWPQPLLFHLTFLSLMLSAITDVFDGYYARKFEVETRFGAHADPLMDKFFYLSTLPLLVFVAAKDHHMPHAVVLLVLTVLFLSRDQWVTFLRSIGSMYNVSGSANWSGKLRTSINFPLVCAIYYFEEAPPAIQVIHQNIIYAAEILAVLVNTISLYVYTRRYWPYVRRSAALIKRPEPAAPTPPGPDH
jgi:CDP-diacylglycerol--glycerol-3-phosphate 3-phosphatidyltransferase